MLFYVVGIFLSLAGAISGIVVGSNSHNFVFCLLVWLSTFLFVIIYFGIGLIITKVDALNKKIDYIKLQMDANDMAPPEDAPEYPKTSTGRIQLPG